MIRSIFVALVVGITCALAGGQEWTRFRGENGAGTGDAANLPVSWTERDYVWKAALPGVGHSSPVLWNDRLLLTSGDPKTADRIILCADAGSGQIRWQKRYASTPFRMHSDNSYASSTCAVDAERVYACWTSPEQSVMVALDHDGREAWKVDLGPFKSQHGSGASPIVLENKVVLGFDQEGEESFILALDSKTGRQIWKTPRKSSSASTCTPCVYRARDGSAQLIFTSRTCGMTAISPTDGSVIWEIADALDRRVVASPILAAGLLIANCGEGGMGSRLVAIRPGEAGAKPKIEWMIRRDAPYVPTPLEKDGLLYLLGDRGAVLCLRAATGEQVWSLKLAAPFYSSPVMADGKLYCISQRGDVFVLAAGDKPQTLGRVPLGDKCFATPAIANGRLYIRTFSQLYCIGPK